MATVEERYVDGVLWGRWDDTGTFTEYAPDGTVLMVRPFTDREAQRLAEWQADKVSQGNRDALLDAGRAGFDLLLGRIDAVKADRDQWAGFTNSDMTAGVLRVAIGQLIATQLFTLRVLAKAARLIFGALDSTDTRD